MEFHVLEFCLWRLRETTRDEWREDIFLSPTDEALDIIIRSFSEVLDSLDEYGEGTWKFNCNLPMDLDFDTYGKEHCVKFQWFD